MTAAPSITFADPDSGAVVADVPVNQLVLLGWMVATARQFLLVDREEAAEIARVLPLHQRMAYAHLRAAFFACNHHHNIEQCAIMAMRMLRMLQAPNTNPERP